MLYTTIKLLYPDISDDDFILQDDGKGPYIAAWNSKYSKPTDEELANIQSQVVLAEQINKINGIATNKILTIAPLYKQNNMLAAGINALKCNDQITLDGLQQMWDRIAAIRNYSNILCDQIKVDINVDINQGWPE